MQHETARRLYELANAVEDRDVREAIRGIAVAHEGNPNPDIDPFDLSTRFGRAAAAWWLRDTCEAHLDMMPSRQREALDAACIGKPCDARALGRLLLSYGGRAVGGS